jgi:hypothetical protein
MIITFTVFNRTNNMGSSTIVLKLIATISFMMSYKYNCVCNSFMMHRVGTLSKIVTSEITTSNLRTDKATTRSLKILGTCSKSVEKDITISEPSDGSSSQGFFNCRKELSDNTHHFDVANQPRECTSRRKCLGTFVRTMGTYSISQLFVTTFGDDSVFTAEAFSLPFMDEMVGGSQRRQLELCLVTIQRMSYWCEKVASEIKRGTVRGSAGTSMPATDIVKSSYLEARLGAKAALTGKIGGGANNQVYTISTFQLRSCIKDAVSYYNEYYVEQNKMAVNNKEERNRLKQQKYAFENAAMEVIESLAALVEFDGLDNIQDPSPRSSLTLSQYTDQKGQFVQRTLLERTVPACNVVIGSFGTDKKMFVQKYISQNYSNEIYNVQIERNVLKPSSFDSTS